MLHQESMATTERSKPRALAAGRSRSWRLLPLLLYFTGVLQARAQPDSNGFISIDCGLADPSYTDSTTNITYSPDGAFTDAGENYKVRTGPFYRTLSDLRSFPRGTRNCYTLRSLAAGNKYLIRADFAYGNYDGLSSPPRFDLHIGVNFWDTVDTSNGEDPISTWWESEAIVVVPDDFVQVCLVNTGSGTPFISGLDLRPLKSSLYPQANATQGLNLNTRRNFGPTDDLYVVRYPDDPYDRRWYPKIDTSSWNVTSTDKMVQHHDYNKFEVPSKVLQTAVTRRNASDSIQFHWTLNPQGNESWPRCIYILHFSELEAPQDKDLRQFYSILNDDQNLRYPQLQQGFAPEYLYSYSVYSPEPIGGYYRYNVAIIPTANSTLPPIINAYEVFITFSTTNNGTDSQDISAITAIKTEYQVNENWVGDPCGPSNFMWKGLNCSSETSGPLRIAGVNMSFSDLNGDISSAFANLTGIQFLDLSYNNLTGSIPDALSQLPSLRVLDLSGNQLNGSIPPGLLKKIQDGSLNLTSITRYDNNPNLCAHDEQSCLMAKAKSASPVPSQKKSKLATYIAVPIALVTVTLSVCVLLFFLRRKRQGPGWVNNSAKPRNETSTSHVPGDAHSSLRLDNRRFTYKELQKITNNFQHVIGRGGFGDVYSGLLEDGTPVAVKLRSESSKQGVKEFVTEAQILTRIHHKNLVSMTGYCKDWEYMALVYEYMSEGSLREHILRKHLTWRQRLRIALESAQGLEYLHTGCNPPLIHRDVKTANILLNAKLEAKVADFGLSKAFNLDICSHVCTDRLVGTPGYVDPEYQATMKPTTKSDVFSFGVVLLELITGKPAVLCDPEPIRVVQWTRQRLARGHIESVVHERMSGDYDINSVWKAAEVALQCAAQASTQRPPMADVVAQLQECLELEEARAGVVDTTQSFYTGSCGDLNRSYDANAYTANAIDQRGAAFEMVEMMGDGPATR